MSTFSEQLRVACEVAELTQSDLSELSGISQSTISRYLKGDVTPEPEAFGALLDSLPATLHFELIVARLCDVLPKKYRDSVTILAQGGAAVGEQASSYMPTGIAKDLRHAIEYLARESVQEPAVRELVTSLARALGSDQTSGSGSVVDSIIEAEDRRRSQNKRDRKTS
jgi:transcriptional regulator with XRE-family HTH domain